MRTRIFISEQAEGFIKTLAPGPRGEVRRALKALNGGSKELDVKPLRGELAGYRRLRINHYRVIFWERAEGGERIIECVFVQERNIVYELFAELLKNSLPIGNV